MIYIPPLTHFRLCLSMLRLRSYSQKGKLRRAKVAAIGFMGTYQRETKSIKKCQGYSFAQANLLCSDSSELEGTSTALEKRTAASHSFAKVDLAK